MSNPNLATIASQPRIELPCQHALGKEVLVCIAGHTNVKGQVAGVTFTDNGFTLYDVYVDQSAVEGLMLKHIPSWRVADLPDNYNGAASIKSASQSPR